MVNILPAAPFGTTDQMSPRHAAVPLEAAFSDSLASLWSEQTPGGEPQADVLGLTGTSDELSSALVQQFIESLGLIGTTVDAAAQIYALLRISQLERTLTARPATGLIERRPPHDQAVQVNAWISVMDNPPRVTVMNNSDAPIFGVRANWALIGYEPNGEISAMVGNTHLPMVQQIDLRSGWGWVLEQCRNWSEPAVRGQLHVDFEDLRGTRWRLGHDQLSQLDS
jgi:hypothetical protein